MMNFTAVLEPGNLLKYLPEAYTVFVAVALIVGWIFIRAGQIGRSLFVLAAVQILFLISYGLLLWDALEIQARGTEARHALYNFFSRQLVQGVSDYALGWLAGLVLATLATWFFVIRKRQHMLDLKDVTYLFFGAAACGWPLILVFLALVFAITVVGMIAMILMRKRKLTDRLIITPFILPAAVLSLIFESQLLHLTNLWKIAT